MPTYGEIVAAYDGYVPLEPGQPITKEEAESPVYGLLAEAAARESVQSAGVSPVVAKAISTQPQMVEAGFGALLPAALSFLTRLPWAQIIPSVGGALAGIGIGSLLGDESEVTQTALTTSGVPFGGLGLAEPLYPYKEWHITVGGTRLQFYRVTMPSGRVKMFCYNTKTKKWSSWTPAKPCVIGKNLPSHRMLSRLRRYLSRQTKDAKTILKLTSPQSLRIRHYKHYRRRK